MKKKLLLILCMFIFMTNAKALSFDVNITNIEDEGNNGTIGTIESIDFDNKTINAYFQDIGDEVSFSITIVNSGDRAGTLRSIDFAGPNGKIEYTSNLPEGGLAINGNDTNEVVITAKIKEGAANGTTSSEISINYSYDEGSCPDGEILSEDESMCLCPEGTERNETGICVTPEKPVECKSDEIYNETKKICEKKVVPVNPSNPKTMDNIILITLLFMVSGLGIYAVMFKRLKTNKKKITAGVITGVITLSLSFTVLASVFGLDNLLSAIVNPITKSKTLTVTVNERIELIETWDGVCDLDVSELTPENIFEGGTGTESDPYQIKTAEQLGCFANSINNGTTYEGKYIKQTKNIKLNDKVLENVENNNVLVLNDWIPMGQIDDSDSVTIIKSFNGTYDGDNHIISGIYINNQGLDYLGFFRATVGATIKNLTLSDNYINGGNYIGTLVAYSGDNTKIDNVKTYGTIKGITNVAGIVGDSAYTSTVTNYTRIENSKNYVNITANKYAAGIGLRYGIIIECENHGNVTAVEGVSGIAYYGDYIIDSENHGDITGEASVTGIAAAPSYMFGTDNYGKITGRIIDDSAQYKGNTIGLSISSSIYDCNNYGDVETTVGTYAVGIAISGSRVYNSGNTGTIRAHDFTSTSSLYYSPMLAGGSSTISDEDLGSDSYLQTYHDIMGKDFVSRNNKSYNTGDVYVSDITAQGFGVTMVGNSGVGNVYNVTTEGNMYITNLTATDYSSTFTRIATDGGNYRNVTSIGDIIVDNFNTEKDLYVTGVGCSGTSVYNSSSEGDIEVKNSSAGGRYCYDEDGYTWCSESNAYIAGGTTSGAYMENSYTKGEIKVHDSSFILDLHVGGVTASGSGATRSYTEKSLEVYNNTGKNLYVGGLGTAGGRGVTDGYNTGDINVYDNTFGAMRVAGGPAGEMFQSGGIYNTGNVYVKDNQASSIQLGGAVSMNSFNNFYNLGDITFETENNTRLTTLSVGGVNAIGNSGSTTYSNLVNTGDITIAYVPSVTSLSVGGVYGIFRSPYVTNAYNSGTISVGEGYTYSDTINYGNVYGILGTDYNPTGATPSAYYTQDGFAMGLSRLSSANAAYDANYATKVNASQVPSVLDIINVNNAFEIKDGETLPTLKVFNQ